MKYLSLSCLFLFLVIANSYGQTDSLMRVAKQLIKQDKYAEAEKVYNTILDRDATNNDARFAMGLLYSWSKQYDKARSVFATVIKARPESKEVYVAALNNELWAEQYNQALVLAGKAEPIFPNDADKKHLEAMLMIVKASLASSPTKEKNVAATKRIAVKKEKKAIANKEVTAAIGED